MECSVRSNIIFQVLALDQMRYTVCNWRFKCTAIHGLISNKKVSKLLYFGVITTILYTLSVPYIRILIYHSDFIKYILYHAAKENFTTF